MDKATSSVVHVVVGAGIIPHFRNAIESILSNTDDRVLAVYNSISPEDSETFSHFALSAGYGSRVEFRNLWNHGPSKTGSLYDAYNLAIDFALAADFQYMNLVQSDCQLMWWNDGLVRRLEGIFAAAGMPGRVKALCVGTVFPVFGKFVGSKLLGRIEFDSDLNTFVDHSVGLVDVGIFSMAAIRATGFRFSGTEAELQERYRDLGYAVPSLGVPCVAFLPWPASVRQGRVVGTVVEPTDGSPLLTFVKDMNPENVGLAWDAHPFWMEDWVKPNGWDCLYPYWPTSIDNPKWLRRRIEASRLLGVKPWARASDVFREGQMGDGPGPFVPARSQIVLALAVGYSLGLMSYLRRLFRSLAKRVKPLSKLG